MKVVILGKGLMLGNIILGAKAAGAEIVGVLRYENTVWSRFKLWLKDLFNPSAETVLIKELKLPLIYTKSANSKEFQRFLIKSNVDIMIVGTWKEKICSQTYNIPKICAINVHPSLLPKYRGPNPYIQTILHNEKFSGVTLHLLDAKYDSGAILKQAKIPIYDNDTSKELRERTVHVAKNLVYELLCDMEYKFLMPIAQDERYATYFHNITGDEKMLDFSEQTSVEISATIRALHPFLPCYITYKDKFFVVNPYKFKVKGFVNYSPSTIIDKNPQNASITIVCKDSVAIEFNDLKLYKSRKVRNYIKNKVQVTT